MTDIKAHLDSVDVSYLRWCVAAEESTAANSAIELKQQLKAVAAAQFLSEESETLADIYKKLSDDSTKTTLFEYYKFDNLTESEFATRLQNLAGGGLKIAKKFFSAFLDANEKLFNTEIEHVPDPQRKRVVQALKSLKAVYEVAKALLDDIMARNQRIGSVLGNEDWTFCAGVEEGTDNNDEKTNGNHLFSKWKSADASANDKNTNGFVKKNDFLTSRRDSHDDVLDSLIFQQYATLKSSERLEDFSKSSLSFYQNDDKNGKNNLSTQKDILNRIKLAEKDLHKVLGLEIPQNSKNSKNQQRPGTQVKKHNTQESLRTNDTLESLLIEVIKYEMLEEATVLAANKKQDVKQIRAK